MPLDHFNDTLVVNAVACRLADMLAMFPSCRFFKEFAGPDALISAVTTHKLTAADIWWVDRNNSPHCITELIGCSFGEGEYVDESNNGRHQLM
jgi:hypothetical protein